MQHGDGPARIHSIDDYFVTVRPAPGAVILWDILLSAAHLQYTDLLRSWHVQAECNCEGLHG